MTPASAPYRVGNVDVRQLKSGAWTFQCVHRAPVNASLKDDGWHSYASCGKCSPEALQPILDAIAEVRSNGLEVPSAEDRQHEEQPKPNAAQHMSNGNGPRDSASNEKTAPQPELLKRPLRPDRSEIPPVPASVEEIKRTIQSLHPDPKDFIEVRVLGSDGKVAGAGFYDRDHIDKAARTAAAQDAKGVYIVLNRIHPGLMALAPNQFVTGIRKTTSDADVIRRRRLLIDFDPIRPAGVSSTDEEKAAAWQVANACLEWLTARGWPQPVVADSGNGFHLLYSIDLPNDDASRDLIKQALINLGTRFSSPLVAVDAANFNAARICKLYGTVARKGFALSDRPHRLSRIMAADAIGIVSFEQLEDVGGKPAGASKSIGDTGRTSAAIGRANLADIEEALKFIDANPRDNWLHVCWALKSELREGGKPIWDSWSQGGGSFNQTDQDATWDKSKADGGIKIGTLFKLARDGGWPGSKSRREPEPFGASSSERSLQVRERTQVGNSEIAAAPQLPAITPSAKPPEAMDALAFHGITGEFARLIEPHTESDINAVVVQFLVYAGSAVGRNAYRMIDGARHSTNLMAVIVGDTSSSRKGSAWARVRQFAALVDEAWVKDHVRAGLSSGKGLVWAVRDPIERSEPIKEKGRYTGEYQVAEVDSGVADKRLLLIESEFMRVLKMAEREGNTLSITIRQAWETGDLQILTKNNPAQATAAHISIIGHITRDELLRGLDSTEAANGFANRFLWACARRSKFLPFGGDLHDSDCGRLVVQMKAVLDWCEAPHAMEFTDSARAAWERVYPALSADRVGLFGATVARASAQVIRLAMLYAVLDRSGQIEVDHLRAALAVWSYCEASAEFIFGDQLGDPDADAIFSALRSSPEGLTRTQIRDLFSRNLTANRIERALTTLATHSLAIIGHTSTAGRPAEIWRACRTTETTNTTKGGSGTERERASVV
jgi:hypothetical protein